MNGQPQRRGHYEVREHAITGLVNIVWHDPAERPTAEPAPGIVVGKTSLPLLADAIGRYLLDQARNGHPVKADAEAAPPPDDLAQRRTARRGAQHS